MSRNYYTSGQWNLICDVCGKKIKSGKSRHRWDGFVVCEDDWEERQPQDFVRARQDKISVPYTRPRPIDAFIVRHVFDFSDNVNASETGSIFWENYIESTYFAEHYVGTTIDLIP